MVRFLALLTVACSLAFLPGCVITEVTKVNTGLCDGDLDKMLAVYEVVKKMQPGKATIDNVEKAGFLVRHHHKTPNIERLDGASAFRKIFGDTYYHGAYVEIRKERGEDAGEEILKESQPFDGYFIPFRVITTRTDRYYFSEKVTIRQGDDLLIRILFKDDVLVHADIKHTKIDTKESTHAFAQGILDIIKEYLGPADAMYDLFDKIKKETKGDKDE